MSDLLVIDIRNLDATGKTLAAPLPVAWLNDVFHECELTAGGEPGAVEIHYSRLGNDLLLRGRTQAHLNTACVRCLGSTPLHIDAEISLLLAPAPSANVGPRTGTRSAKKKPLPEVEFSAAEAAIDTYEGDRVVLDAFVREAILLEVPPFPLCSDSCAGIGVDSPPEEKPAVDPRPAPLLAFAKPTNR